MQKSLKEVIFINSQSERWIREAVHILRGQERTMNHYMGQFKLSSMYILIFSDSKTTYTPSTASHRQSDEGCSKQ